MTSMQDATEICHYPELVGEPLRQELNLTFPLEHVFELVVLGERISLVAVDKFGVLGKNILNGYCFSQKRNQSHPATQILVHWFNSF